MNHTVSAPRLKYNYWSFRKKKNPLDIKKLHNFSFAFWTVMCYTRKKQETLKKTKKRARDVISDKTNFQA